MHSSFSTEPIAATSDCTPQQARYAKLLSLSSEELNAMVVRYHRLGGHVRLRLAEVFLAIQETAQYNALGASGVIAYARNLRYEPSTTFEYIRIARLCLPPSVPPRGRLSSAYRSPPPLSSTGSSLGPTWPR